MGIMPTSITHQLLAEETLKTLPENLRRNVRSLPHYYLGAQGPDVCFTYRPLKTLDRNFGSFIHANGQLLFFTILQRYARESAEMYSYALGYLTHYASDTVFHPVIYRRLHEEDGKSLLHHSLEHAYDGVLLKYLRGKNPATYRLPDLRAIDLYGVYRFYRDFARESGWGELEREAFERAVKHYLRLVSIRLPVYRKGRALRAKELFFESKDRAIKLAQAFEEKNGIVAHSGLFSMNYLTGKFSVAT